MASIGSTWRQAVPAAPELSAVGRTRSMKQLAVIATIFLPLAWLTGFFGQNFGRPVRRIGGWETFVGLGVGTELLALAILLAFFKRRGWF
jgi:magnesium transporter